MVALKSMDSSAIYSAANGGAIRLLVLACSCRSHRRPGQSPRCVYQSGLVSERISGAAQFLSGQ